MYTQNRSRCFEAATEGIPNHIANYVIGVNESSQQRSRMSGDISLFLNSCIEFFVAAECCLHRVGLPLTKRTGPRYATSFRTQPEDYSPHHLQSGWMAQAGR